MSKATPNPRCCFAVRGGRIPGFLRGTQISPLFFSCKNSKNSENGKA